MNTSELRKRIYTLLEKVENQEALKQYYNYLKKASNKEISKLWEQFNTVYSYKKIPEEGTQEAPDFISQVTSGLK
jgi:hypothetical protein